MSSKEKIILLLLASLNFTHILDFMIMMPLNNYLIPYFNISPQQFSYLVAAYTFSAGISGFFAAFFVDRFDRKKILLFGYIGFLIGSISCGIANSYLLLLSARIFAGMFGGLIGAQVLSIVADSIPYERRGFAMSWIMASFSVASVFGVPFGLFLANKINWHAPFLFVGLLGILIIPIIIKVIPAMNKHIEEKAKRENPIELVKSILSDRNQVLALGLSACLMMGHFMIIPFLNPYMEFNMGFSKLTQTPLIYMIGGSLTLVSSPIIGRMADKFGKHKLFLVMVSLGLIPIALITNLPPIPFYAVLCITGFWFVVSSGRSIPAQAMISNVVKPEKRGSFMSFNSSIQQIFVGVASIISGMIVVKAPDHKLMHYEITGYISIGIILLSTFFATKLHTRSLQKTTQS